MSIPVTKPILAKTDPLRVMVVDDSLVLRGVIGRMINEDPSAEVVASVANGQLAIDRAQKKDIDVVVLDIEMPVMDGITALPKLLATNPRLVIIMASTLATRNADISLKAMAAGAKDYVPKPTSVTPGAGAEEFKRDLLEKIRTLGGIGRRMARIAGGGAAAKDAVAKKAAIVLRPAALARPAILAIGSSTGGPNALIAMLKGIPKPLKVPCVITQHMPPTFTTLLAENITRETGHKCAEGVHGEPVVAGRIYMAPGDYHMTVAREGLQTVIQINQDAKENFCRPAVDPMFRSLVAVYQRNILGVILTGMGQDGLLGAGELIKAGANLVAQDEATSTVWGMPGAVAKAGLCCAVVPITDMGREVSKRLGS